MKTMTELITNRDTGTTHIVCNEGEAEWKSDRSYCGQTGVARELTTHNAVDAATNLCGKCRAQANAQKVREIEEMGDESLDN